MDRYLEIIIVVLATCGAIVCAIMTFIMSMAFISLLIEKGVF